MNDHKRGIAEKKLKKMAEAAFSPTIQLPAPRYPWFIGDDGVEQQGPEGATLMRYLKDTLGLTTPEIWQLQMEVGKRE